MSAHLSHRGVLERAVHTRLLAEASSGLPDGPTLSAAARLHVSQLDPLLPDAVREHVVAGVVARIRGLGPLDEVMADPSVTEVMVNGGRDVWVERAGVLERLPLTLTAGEADLLVERILAPLGVSIDRLRPLADARLPDGSRVHAVIAPVAADGTCLTIRRFGTVAVDLSAFGPPAVVQLLIAAVAARLNVVVSGATSSGKTTLLNALAAHCPSGERIITIEDAAELRLRGDHVVRLESRSATADGAGSVSIRALVRAALRMRPDRLVIGEVRGHEAFDAVQAMNTGHDGSLTTVHANSAVDALRRLEAMMLAAEPGLPLVAVREQVHGSIDLVIQVGRGDDGRRRIVQIAEVATEPNEPRVRVLSDGVRVIARPARHRIGKEDRC